MWDEREPWPADREPKPRHGPRLVVVFVFAVVLIGTLVACCASVGPLFELFELEAPGVP